MSTRIDVEITVSADGLTEWDLDELEASLQDASSAWKAVVTVTSRREYDEDSS
ncbi:hypothetical protein AB0D47_20300 [Streptomyces sp. NPDC048376]|uniref:hypothetical protein n=1 Tax=Streptomyces sp. NPDC048376 TaxID=3154926 RepID=UPI0034176263